MKKSPVAGKAMGMEKASKSMGTTSTSMMSKKGNKAYCPKISKLD